MRHRYLHRLKHFSLPAFSMLEVIIGAGIVSLLSLTAALYLSVDKTLSGADDAMRVAQARGVQAAFEHYLVTNGHLFGEDMLEEGEENAVPICAPGVTNDATCLNMDELSDYIDTIPVDPDELCLHYTGYKAYLKDGLIVVKADRTTADEMDANGSGCPAASPLLTDISATSITASSTTIVWFTNENSDSQVEYGTTSSYGTSTSLDTSMVTSHSQPLTGLAELTVYHYRVRSKDTDGNTSISDDYTFTTGETVPPVISAITTSNISSNMATVTWTTDEISNTQVEYGTTTSYGSAVVDASMVIGHNLDLTNLVVTTLYHYRVKSRDSFGNQAVSGDNTFTTIVGSAPILTNVAAGSIGGTTATITWTTNEVSDTQVEYGTTAGYGTSTTLNTSMVTSHSQGLTGLATETLYHYRVRSKDVDTNLALSDDATFSTLDVTAPVLSAIAASPIAGTTATITWTTNEASDTQVDYGTTASYGSSTVLNTSMVTSHSQDLTGLAEMTLYHYRVKSNDASSNLATSSDNTFTTIDATAPVLSAVASSAIADTSATITWTTNEASDTQVEYGTTTSYGSSTTLNTAMVTSHSQDLTGLASAVLYHYRVKSKDASNNLATSSDATFTTTDTTAPVISAVTSSSVFGTSASITWTTNEPSDTQVEYGTTIAYGTSTTINTTLLTSHGKGLSGLLEGTLYHYRVKSKDASNNLATSGDYTFTTLDTTAPVLSSIAASSIAGTTATITWTTNEASDSQVNYGTTISYGLSTTLDTTMVTSHSQGLSGLSQTTLYHYRVKSKDASNNLATSGDNTFTTLDTTAPVISAVSATAIWQSSASIIWFTNEASDTQVEYGTTTSYGSSTTLLTGMVTSHSQAVTGLSAVTLYHYRVKSKDASSNLATSGDYTFTTTDATAPTVAITSPPYNGNLINTTDNVTATASDNVGVTRVDFFFNGSSTPFATDTTSPYAVTLDPTGIAYSRYGITAKAYDAANNMASDYIEAWIDSSAPTLSSIASAGVTGVAATINWSSNENSNSQVEYGTTVSYGSSTVVDGTMSTFHSMNLSGLANSTLYHYRVKSRDASNNLATSGDFTFTTLNTTAPVLSSIAASSITGTTATITWTTNENSNSQVDYGTTISYGSSTTLDATMVTSHSQGLSSLSETTLYHYRVKSKDASNNLAISGDNTFTTLDATAPVLSAIASSAITGNSATITWTTNENADTQVEYGTTTSYGSSTTLNSSMVTSHSQGLSSLSNGMLYHYRVKSRDASNNLATSSDFTFTTLDTTAPTFASITAGSITSYGASITWTTNESSDTQVDYGLTTGYGTSTTLDVTMVTSHSASITSTGFGSATKLSNPAALPAGNGTAAAFSADNTYLAVGHATTPFVTIYKRTGDTFAKLANPATLPTGQVNGASFSSDGVYLALSHTTSPYVTIYKRSDDVFTKLANPATLPTGNGFGVSFSADTTYLSVAHTTTPFVTIYKRSGDVFTKLANPATLPTGQGNGTDFSSDGVYLSVAHTTSPFITIYKRSGDVFTKLANPATLPTGIGNRAAFSPDVTYLAVAHATTPFITIYKRSGDVFTKLANPTTLPASTGNGVDFSADNTYLGVAHATTPFITFYSRSGDVFTKLTNPGTLPASTGMRIGFSPNNMYAAVAHTNTPFVTIYKQPGALVPNTLYHYRVKSRDAAGNLGTSSDFTFTTSP